MAYLNVRERRIEAKIAYVGPQLSGKGTNIERLRHTTRDARIGRVEATTTADGDQLSVAWQLAQTARFRDCDVLVRVVAHRGAAAELPFEQVLNEVDGVVVVVDAHPLAQTRNRISLAAVRGAIQRGGRRDVPIVLQVNKTDLPDSLAANDVVAALDATDLPHVAASAAHGRGVVETLEEALNQVLASMQKEVEASGAPVAEVRPTGHDKGAEPGHPLLSALRQVLRDTVREHVAELEARLVVRLDASMARVAERLAGTEAACSDLRKTLTEIGDVMMEVSHRTTALTDRAHATLEAVRDVAPSLDRVSLSINQSAVRIEDSVRALHARTLESASREQMADVHAGVADILKELRIPKRSSLD